MSEYAKSNDGLVHAVNIHGGEHTICGDAFNIDAGDESAKDFAWKWHTKGPVTCPNCCKIILSLRGMRCKPAKT